MSNLFYRAKVPIRPYSASYTAVRNLMQTQVFNGCRRNDHSRTMVSISSDNCKDRKPEHKFSGRIWIHRPFNIMPALTSLSPHISLCPLPITSPPSSPESKLHNLNPISLKKFLEAKSQMFRNQYDSHVTSSDAHLRIERRTIKSPCSSREVEVTVYVPSMTSCGSDGDNGVRRSLNGICLHVHGGGWLWGDSQYQVAHRCLEISEELNVAVVSVEYSLLCQNDIQRDCFTESSFDPVLDVITVVEWIETQGRDELCSKNEFVASGESSGAHLLLSAMIKRRDQSKATFFEPLATSSVSESSTKSQKNQLSPLFNWKCLNLVYGVYDLSGTPSVRSDGETSSPLCGKDLLWLYDKYFSSIKQQNDAEYHNIGFHHPSISPMYANLSHLPPALMTIGTLDPLFDDSLIMASRYARFGNYVELAVYEGGEHGLGHFGLQEKEEMGKRAKNYTIDFLKRFLKGDEKPA